MSLKTVSDKRDWIIDPQYLTSKTAEPSQSDDREQFPSLACSHEPNTPPPSHSTPHTQQAIAHFLPHNNNTTQHYQYELAGHLTAIGIIYLHVHHFLPSIVTTYTMVSSLLLTITVIHPLTYTLYTHSLPPSSSTPLTIFTIHSSYSYSQ